MLRCGLRVEKTASLKLDDLDLRKGTIIVRNGKGAKGTMVNVSPDALSALTDYFDLKVQNDCYKAMELVFERTLPQIVTNYGNYWDAWVKGT